jgi:hypothetical protein
MAVTDSVADFSIGRVVSQTFLVVTRNLGIFLIAAALVMVPVIALNLYVGTPNYFLAGRTQGFLIGALSAILPVVCTYLLQATLVQGTVAELNGERPNLGHALSTGFSLLLPVAAIAILAALGTTLGMILLVVPGMILGVGWCVAVPVKVVEHTSIKDSFGRSWNLTKGYRWKIFALLLIFAVIIILFAFLVTMFSGLSLIGASTALHNTTYILLQWLQSVILGLIMAVGGTVIYYELRAAKEGLGPQQLAEAFD